MSAIRRKSYPSEKADQFIVRLPEGMRDRIKQSAEENCRTMNSEIVFHLRRAIIDSAETKKPTLRPENQRRLFLTRERSSNAYED